MSTLYPQNNEARTMVDLGGVWEFRFQGDEKWQTIAVPASYNDQDPDPRFRNYAGIVEYRRKITIPSAWKGLRVCLRFDAVAHDARILLDGKEIAKHRGGFLPFEAELDGLLNPGEKTRTIRVGRERFGEGGKVLLQVISLRGIHRQIPVVEATIVIGY